MTNDPPVPWQARNYLQSFQQWITDPYRGVHPPSHRERRAALRWVIDDPPDEDEPR